MSKVSNPWMFSFVFFVFLSSFLVVKGVFILFFQASFDPPFILQLTPLYLISSVSSMQLFFFSLIVVVVDTYLHIKDTKRNLLYSLIPTGVIIGGVTPVIIMNEFSVEYTVHYLLFSLLLIILVLDHRRTLPVESLKKYKSVVRKPVKRKAVISASFLSLIDPGWRTKPSFKTRVWVKKPSSRSRVEQEIEDVLNAKINKSYSRREKKKILSEIEMVEELCQLEGMKPSYADTLIDAGIKSLKELAEENPERVVKVFADTDLLQNVDVTSEVAEKWINSAKTLVEQGRDRCRSDVFSPKYLNRD